MELGYRMKMLALDTSSSACSVAFVNDCYNILKHEVIPKQHAQSILSFIAEVLPCPFFELDALAWGCGPGSFTGLRIAAGVMQSLMFTYNLPLIDVSSLAAIAQVACQAHDACQEVIVTIDAGMGEVYWGKYRVDEQDNLILLAGEGRIKISELSQLPISPDCYVVGEVWNKYELECKVLDISSYPSALAIAKLAQSRYCADNLNYKINVTPNYLRNNLFSSG